MATKKIKLESIRIDGGTQPRESIDDALVSEYAECVEDLPPMVVFDDGVNVWLADGFHRHHALQRAGRTMVECDVRKGTQRDAVLYSVGANADHGKRRTNADKRKAVQTLLNDEEWGKWSDREIAKRCRVSHVLVGQMRPAHLEELPDSTTERKASRGGTTYTVKTENIGKKAPAESSKPKSAPPPEVEPLSPYEVAKQGIEPLRILHTLVLDCLKAAQVVAKDKACGHFFRHQQAETALTMAKDVVNFAMPKSPCPYMPNCIHGKCKTCRGAGWIPKDIYDRLSKDELAMLKEGKR